ncbi:MAG: SDR family NAD(P)-dependent oxidoreductase, partial [Rikenellaceae bacterium]|nr:SDR family NAD(P)-dependent oxidoreductase [Rikenellaceae bacterium]
RMTTPLGGWYHASKFALEGLSAALRQEVAPFGIDVILIEPGIIDTPWWEKARRNLESVSSGSAYRTQIAQWKTVLQIDPATSGHPMEVARVILKALAARKPQTRYAVGGNAEGILMARKLLSDHAFDHAVDTLTKTKAREGENRKGSNDRE